jgi:hypothetical protein
MAGANTGSAGEQKNPKPVKSVHASGANTGSAGEQKSPRPIKSVKNK